MKVVLLAGGLGTRISEESHLKPKPMIEVGGRPILWHIMKLYSHYGFNDFIVCLGYKGYVVKEYFANYVLHNADLTVDLAKGAVEYGISMEGKCPIPTASTTQGGADVEVSFAYYMAYFKVYNDGTPARMIGSTCPECGVLNP